MRAAFVVGFYNPVTKALKGTFDSEIKTETLRIFPRESSQHAFDVSTFKAQLLQEPAEVLIVAPDFEREKGFEWVSQTLTGLRDSAAQRAGAGVKLVICKDTQNPDPIVGALQEFGLGCHGDTHDSVPEHVLMMLHGGRRILCVRGRDQPSYEDALRRANFQFQNFETHFVELVLPYGSNVGNTVKKFSNQHPCLLYAWGVLKYLPPAIKAKWRHFYTGDSPSAAVNWFKQALTKAASAPKK